MKAKKTRTHTQTVLLTNNEQEDLLKKQDHHTTASRAPKRKGFYYAMRVLKSASFQRANKPFLSEEIQVLVFKFGESQTKDLIH